MDHTPPHNVDAEARAAGDLSTARARPVGENIAGSLGVLVLGHDEGIRELVDRICSQEGWQAATATLMEDARAMLGAGTFAVALVTGPHARHTVTELEALREWDPNMCVVVVAEDRCDDQGTHSMEDGTCAVFSKPVSEGELRHVLRHTIAERYWQQRVRQTEEARNQADLALRRALHQTWVILESLPSAILVVREDLTILTANALASRYFEDARCSLIGTSLRDILPEAELNRCRLMFRMAPSVKDQGSWRQGREFQAGERVMRYECFPVVLDDGDKPHVGLTVWDVTEEKQMQDQLVQAEKLASLGTMVSGMAHEVNNPSQAILGLAEIMMDETAPEKIQEYAADIAGYAQHIAAVVRDFACYARSSSREGEFDVDINQRLVDAVKMVRRGPHFGYVEVITNLQPLPALRARRSEIEQIFVNLIGNAVQAMQGRGHLTLSTCCTGGKVVVTISDTGSGIPQGVRSRIFDPFFTTKEPGKGTGLGLSIVHTIVTKYGGSISVESEEGMGTTFHIEFPIGSSSQGGA